MQADDDDHYRSLSIPRQASSHEVLAAYRKKAAALHPDVGGDPYGWATIQRAYDTLIDAESRAAYDGDAGEEEEAFGEEDDGDDGDSDGESASDEPWRRELEPFDLLATLGLARCGGSDDSNTVGGPTRCRAPPREARLRNRRPTPPTPPTRRRSRRSR